MISLINVCMKLENPENCRYRMDPLYFGLYQIYLRMPTYATLTYQLHS